MTAANQDEFEITNRRLGRLLIFLSVFLTAVILIACGTRWHWFGSGPSTTFFDPKGILTGPGTFIVLIGAALSALIVFVAYKKWTLRHAATKPAITKDTQATVRVLEEWLTKEVLTESSASGAAAKVDGTFRGRHFLIERIDPAGIGDARVRFTIDTTSTLQLKVWWLGKTRAEAVEKADANTFTTSDPNFENCCAWQSENPQDALSFLNRGDITGTLHRMCFLSGRIEEHREIGISFEPRRIVLTTRTPPLEFMLAPSVLVSMQDLIYLADAAEKKEPRAMFAGINAPTADSLSAGVSNAPVKPVSKFMHVLSCMMFVTFVLVPLAALWIAGSYYCAKALDMSAGMLCFFVPVLLMAIFVFTRPAAPQEGTAAVNDMETVRAAALKYWEQTLRTDSQYAALLDTYERRTQKS